MINDKKLSEDSKEYREHVEKERQEFIEFVRRYGEKLNGEPSIKKEKKEECDD